MPSTRSPSRSRVRAHHRYAAQSNESRNRYFIELSRYEPLTRDEECTLSQRIRHGDEEAFRLLVLANLRFVVSVARSYENQGLPLADLIEAGNIGLMEAARRFDGRKNFRFITYAAWWVRRSIIEELAFQSRAIRIPFNRIADLLRIEKVKESLQHRRQGPIDPLEVGEELSIAGVELAKLLPLSRGALSLDSSLPDGQGTLHDVVPDSRETDEPADRPLDSEITSALSSLNRTEKEVVNLYYGIGHGQVHTLKEIGRRLDLSRERIRQIKDRALEKLRNPTCSSRLREFY